MMTMIVMIVMMVIETTKRTLRGIFDQKLWRHLDGLFLRPMQ